MNSLIAQTLVVAPDLEWLACMKMNQVVQMIRAADHGLHTIGYIQGFQKSSKTRTDEYLETAHNIAKKLPIDVNPEKVVFFSGTSQRRAENFVAENIDYDVIHTTLPGALLAAMQLFDDELDIEREQRLAPWNILSSRLAHLVKDNTTAILDLPKPTATFINYEMPTFLLENHNIHTINKTDKWAFWNALEILDLGVEHAVEHKENILTSHKQKLILTK